MVEVLQFKTPCGAMTSIETTSLAFERTKGFAEGAVFGCRQCNDRCTLWHIARVESHEELMRLLKTPGISDKTVGK